MDKTVGHKFAHFHGEENKPQHDANNQALDPWSQPGCLCMSLLSKLDNREPVRIYAGLS